MGQHKNLKNEKIDEIKNLIQEIIDSPVELKGINYELLNILISSYLGEELVKIKIDNNNQQFHVFNKNEIFVLKIAKKFLESNGISIDNPSFDKKKVSVEAKK